MKATEMEKRISVRGGKIHLEYQMREKHREELSRFIEGWIDVSGKKQSWKK
jgi:hypothetical protein